MKNKTGIFLLTIVLLQWLFMTTVLIDLEEEEKENKQLKESIYILKHKRMSTKKELNELLDKVIDKNGGWEELKKYYKDQGLTKSKLYKDIWLQIPPLDRQRLPNITDREVKSYLETLD